MKTIEEKARAYDEAIGKAAVLYKASEPMSGCNVILETIFPELKESEDEKVRKELIKHLKELSDWKEDEVIPVKNPSYYRQWASWLEKQGEKKPADSYCQENCKGFQETGKCFADGECKAKREAEQKPDWSEDDETKRNALINLVKEIKNHPLKRLEDWDGYINWLQSLQDRVQPQPKQEWSEEDKKIINGLIDSLTRISLNTRTDFTSPNYTFYKEIDWLKSLRPQKCLIQDLKRRVQPQPKQEWSKKDEAYALLLDSICESSEAEYYDNPDSIIRKEIVNARLWLKSLRPQNNITDEELVQAKKDAYNDALDKIEYHSGEPTFDDGWSAAIWFLKKRNTVPQSQWKPSEEQMMALLYHCSNGSVLTSLYNDLNKLKEE